MEKAIEVKRRAQRCIQNGDLDGALNEYEKLVAAEDSDPYNFVLLADLLFKKGDTSAAGARYLTAAQAYEKAGLYKNGIAVCKKMMRLSLSTSPVLERLAVLHELDGLSTESGLYYVQFAEIMVREDHLERAAGAFRKAFDTCPENVKPLERLAEVQALMGDRELASQTLLEAATHYQRCAQLQDADRCRTRASQLGSGVEVPSAAAMAGGPAVLEEEPPPPGPIVLDAASSLSEVTDPGSGTGGPPRFNMETARPPAGSDAHDPNTAGPPRLSPAVGDAEHDPWFEATSHAPAANGTSAAQEEIDPGPHDEVAEALRSVPSYEVESTSDAPGIQFEEPGPAVPGTPKNAGLGRVEQLLAQAQELFRAGHREAAGLALADAAREYDVIGQHDSAATIYRSLSKGAHAGAEIMMAWLRNCEMRNDRVEAAQVACELGDRALNDGDVDGAKRWFERAAAFDPASAHAQRRLQRMAPPPAEPEAPPPPRPAPESAPEVGRVEVAVGRGEAVTFDLGSLVSEFQRGVEMQLSGDAQGHYDIAMAYREMGLLEQAVEAFRTASQDPAFGPRSAEMIGRCLLDQGRFDEAAEEFISALRLGQAGPELSADLRYQLGLAHEAAGRLEAALGEFEQVYAAQSNYPDVALKIRVLRKTLGNG